MGLDGGTGMKIESCISLSKIMQFTKFLTAIVIKLFVFLPCFNKILIKRL